MSLQSNMGRVHRPHERVGGAGLPSFRPAGHWPTEDEQRDRIRGLIQVEVERTRRELPALSGEDLKHARRMLEWYAHESQRMGVER